jgi:hypothetical protein
MEVLGYVLAFLGTLATGYAMWRSAGTTKPDTTEQRLERRANMESITGATYRGLIEELRKGLADCEQDRKADEDAHTIELSNKDAIIRKHEIECAEAVRVEVKRRKDMQDERDRYASTLLECQRKLRKFLPPDEIPQVNANGTTPTRMKDKE